MTNDTANAVITPTAIRSRWKMIACDLDGTLIGRNHKVNERDLAALRAARAAGIHVAICTGRISMESAGVIGPLELTGPGVFATGAMVADMGDGRTLHARPIASPIVQEVIDFFGQHGHASLALADDPATRLPAYFLTDHGPPHRAATEWLLLNRVHFREFREIPANCRDRIVRLGIVLDVPQAQPLVAALAARFAGRLAWHSMLSPYYDCQVIELFSQGTSKWSGIQGVAALLGIRADQVVAIGDDINDLPMLQNAALSFAMGNAAPDIQAAAKHVTGAQTDCGVAQVIDLLLRNSP